MFLLRYARYRHRVHDHAWLPACHYPLATYRPARPPLPRERGYSHGAFMLRKIQFRRQVWGGANCTGAELARSARGRGKKVYARVQMS